MNVPKKKEPSLQLSTSFNLNTPTWYIIIKING